jgi:hypothetical protein
MKLSIIVADNSVAKNEVGYVGLDLSTCSIPANVWALQWDGIKGHIEYQGQGVNTEIDELPNWAEAAEIKWQAAKDSFDALKEAEENATPVAEAFWDNYPVANIQSVDKILLKTYPGVTNVRGADPVTNVVKSVQTTLVAPGATALASLETLLNECKALGLPVTSDAFAQDTPQSFKDYMVGLGYTIYSGVNALGQSYEKVYYPWSDDLAAKKADQDVNIAREASLAEGVDWNGSNWQIDLNSRNNVMNQLTAITSGVYTDATVTWRNTANVDVELTVDEFKELAGAVNAKVEEIYLASFAAKA